MNNDFRTGASKVEGYGLSTKTFFELPVLGQRMASERSCTRCGACCLDIQIPFSPEEIKERAERGLAQFQEVLPIWQYVGKWNVPFGQGMTNAQSEHHYKCIHAIKEESGLYSCAIHATRPLVCKGFPHYHGFDHTADVDPDRMLNQAYASQYANCGYNVNDDPPAFPYLPDQLPADVLAEYMVGYLSEPPIPFQSPESQNE